MAITLVLYGMILIIGTRLNFKIFVDPPESLSLFYTASRIKKYYGVKFLKYFNYVMGWLAIILGMFIIYRSNK